MKKVLAISLFLLFLVFLSGNVLALERTRMYGNVFDTNTKITLALVYYANNVQYLQTIEIFPDTAGNWQFVIYTDPGNITLEVTIGATTKNYIVPVGSDYKIDFGIWISPTSASRNRGTTCYDSRVKSLDSSYAGLAMKSSDNTRLLSGQSISSCIKADFGKSYDVLKIRIKSKTVKSLCGDSCSGSYCNTGGGGKIFYYSQTQGAWIYAKNIARSTSSLLTEANVHDKVRYVLICRDSSNYKRDNLAIDSVEIFA